MGKKKPNKGPRAATNGGFVGNGFQKSGASRTHPEGGKASMEQKLNPFERMWNRRKFDVLGKKAKGEQRKVGLSRSHAVDIRKNTLLQEYRQSKKANAFIDRRFGELDESLAEEDKAIMRYQKERLAQLNKRSRFNLQDDDVSGGEEEMLTHRGIPASDDFDDVEVPGAEDENDAELDAEIVDKLHFGGFEPAKGGAAGQDSKPKSRKEVMEELIAKSKFYKAQKAKEKEETDDLLGSLDEHFKELTQQGLLTSKPSKKGDLASKKGDVAALMAKYGLGKGADGKVADGVKDEPNGVKETAGVKDRQNGVREKRGGVEELGAGVYATNGKSSLKDKKINDDRKIAAEKKSAEDTTSAKNKVSKGGEKRLVGSGGEAEKDDYERLAREMASDLRARASDRMKDPEEAAKEERERLEKLEKKRKKRMEGLEDESEGEDSDDEGGGRKAQKRRKRAEASGDDLGENFVLEEKYQQEGWATDVMKKGEEEDDDEGSEEDEEDDDVSGDDDDVSDDDDDVSGDEDDVIADGDDVSGEEGDDDDDVSGSGGESGSDSDTDLDAFLGAVQREKDRRKASQKPAEISNGDPGKVPEAGHQSGSRSEAGQPKERSKKETVERDPSEGPVTNDRKATGKSGTGKGVGESKSGKGARKEGQAIRPRGELPYVIDAPQTLELFRAIVDGRSDAELALAVERIRACNSVNLAAENRRKMQVFYSVLVQYFSAIAGDSPLPLSRIDVLVKPLLEMSQDTPLIAAVNARERILKMQQQLSAKLREADGTSCWPSARTVLLLRLWTLTFPPSDFRHPVTTPLAILVGEYLARCYVASHRDAAIGAFLAAFALQIHSAAARFCPEALNLLHALLLTALPPSKTGQIHPSLWGAVPAYLKDQVGSQHWLYTGGQKAGLADRKTPAKVTRKAETIVENGNDHTAPHAEPLDLVSILSAGSDAREFDTQQWKECLLATVLETVIGFVSLYKNLQSFPELLRPFLRTLEALETDGNGPEAVTALIRRVSADISKTSADVIATRQSVRMRKKRAEPIKQYNPRFEEDGYVPGRDYDPDRERAEKKKLRKQLKKETKGAARELRKDNYFLAEEKRRDKLVADDERQEKYRSAMAFLQQQEGAFKSGQLGGGKRKRK